MKRHIKRRNVTSFVFCSYISNGNFHSHLSVFVFTLCNHFLQYRQYEDKLLVYKSWCMIWVVIAIVPTGLAIISSGMNLNWTFMAAQVFIAPFIVPLFLTITWAKATDKGLISGKASDESTHAQMCKQCIVL